jgi:hypothetical protein
VPVVIIAIVVILIGIVFGAVVVGMAGGSTGGKQGGSAPSTTSTADCQKLSGTPKQIVDKVALPIAHEIAFRDVTAESVEAANAAHSTSTSSGNLSDHKGPPERAWAADISNGSAPTPEMDKLAKDLADCFGFPPEQWQGGCNTATKDGYRIQLIYRTDCGGNHYNHVHIGVAKG